jgi:hypothetical protein
MLLQVKGAQITSDEDYSILLNHTEWLENPSQMNGDILNNVQRETSRYHKKGKGNV